ncbi:ankyrin repeat domain-containing protein [Shewanella woodyi]|uniref:Ankyrin n=1 Tax=Shewanella woodyi (strain ATCC 51908 / MS32) TaxID=392500 RepID=B1KFS8_SHEWM|nr:ankyrin repeat domain-containing protein [Shewanella woodyi]ACA85244.1 Ankyrin [Shewanella woodyi ATCC 51908]
MNRKMIAFSGFAIGFLLSTTASATSFSEQDIMLYENAAGRGKLQQIKDFIAQGMPVDAKREYSMSGATPLMLSLKFCKPEIVSFLLKQGASLTIKDEDGETATDYAKKACDEVKSLIL